MAAVILGDDWSREALKHRLPRLEPLEGVSEEWPGQKVRRVFTAEYLPSLCDELRSFLITIQTRVADC